VVVDRDILWRMENGGEVEVGVGGRVEVEVEVEVDHAMEPVSLDGVGGWMVDSGQWTVDGGRWMDAVRGRCGQEGKEETHRAKADSGPRLRAVIKVWAWIRVLVSAVGQSTDTYSVLRRHTPYNAMPYCSARQGVLRTPYLYG
jgi:hypothetical protein